MVVVVVGGNGIKAKLSQTELVWDLTELGNTVFMNIKHTLIWFIEEKWMFFVLYALL